LKFPKQTDLNAVKSVARTFLYLPIEETEVSPIVVQHPFYENGFMMLPNSPEDPQNKMPKMLDLLNSSEDVIKANAIILERIKAAKSAFHVLLLLRTAYRLTFIKYAKNYLNREDFNKMLADAWTETENPNRDPNVSLTMVTRWFRAADPMYLMSEEERKVYNSFENGATVYRGVAVGRNPMGLSWTDNYEKAFWFAHRFDIAGESGYVQKAQVPRDKMLVYFLRRGEYELVVDTKGIEITGYFAS